MKKATIKDVAKKAGVGVSTISRYYNNGYVSLESKKKIKQAIEILDYVPNASAKALKGVSSEVAVIVERINSHAASIFLEQLLIESKKLGLDVSIHVSNFDTKKRNSIIDNLVRKNVKKIIVLPFEDFYVGHEEKIVIVGQKSLKYKYITYDEIDAINEMLEYVKKLCFKRVKIIGYEINDPTLAKRTELVAKFCNLNNLEFDAKFYSFEKNEIKDITITSDTYYFCMTDTIAQIVYFIAQKNNKKVIVTGFGDYGISSDIGISSIANDYVTAAKLSILEIDSGKTIKSKLKLR